MKISAIILDCLIAIFGLYMTVQYDLRYICLLIFAVFITAWDIWEYTHIKKR